MANTKYSADFPDFSKATIERFWCKVKISTEDSCWEWSGSRLPSGYGKTLINDRSYLAHRVAVFLTSGEQPGQSVVCHKCDNPPCCNPNHLFLGTQKANAEDMIRKGRASTGDRHWTHRMPELTNRGSRQWNNKLTENDVRDIRRQYESGVKTKVVAQQYGIGRAYVSQIGLRSRWGWLD